MLDLYSKKVVDYKQWISIHEICKQFYQQNLEKTTTIIYSLLNKKADKRGRKAKK